MRFRFERKKSSLKAEGQRNPTQVKFVIPAFTGIHKSLALRCYLQLALVGFLRLATAFSAFTNKARACGSSSIAFRT